MQSQGDQIRPFLQLSRQKITHRKSNTFRTTKIVARDWDDGGKREDEHPALHDVGRSFRRSFNSSELSWRPYGNSSNNFKSFKSQVQQQKRSYKSQCVHTTTVATRAGEPQLRQLGGRDSYEEEEAFGETNPAFQGVLGGFTPSIVTLLPSLPQNCKHDQHFPYAAQPQTLQPHLHSTCSFAHYIHLHGWEGLPLAKRMNVGMSFSGNWFGPYTLLPRLVMTGNPYERPYAITDIFAPASVAE